ncbi:hypothetical protein [Agromyces humi]|uniref:hypothetical protein n=1 Tax=Agromyces humi TaxID=1766800 RepID=UPI001358C526|nr:hypothetical protein [Agromyces humi]
MDDLTSPDAGTTPEADGRRYSSLNEALQAHGIPVENHRFIQAITEQVGIAEYFGTSSYIKAVRQGAGPALNISYGWTNGFRSEEEARRAAGEGANIWPSQRGKGQWGVGHPEHGSGSGGGAPAKVKRDYGVCEVCFTAYSANGSCLC